MRTIVIVGPTSSGKSALALRLAEAMGNAEIVSADSQQVYRDMDIGTGKASAAERARVPHHLLDVLSPEEVMTAARFVELADAALRDLARRGKVPIVVGGTGLYVRAFLYGLFEGPAADAELRARLEGQGAAALAARLAVVDPQAVARIGPNDVRRLVRALEVFELTGTPISELQRAHDVRHARRRHVAQVVGLDPPRDELRRRIGERVDAMVTAGLLDEVRRLAAAGYDLSARAFDAIGYREARAVLRGELGEAEMPEAMKAATRRFARRQLSWFRSEPEITWYNAAEEIDLARLAAWPRAEGD